MLKDNVSPTQAKEAADRLKDAVAAASHEASPHSVSYIARVAHEVNREYCMSLGDDSQPKWEDAPEWQKQSAINGVEFHIANPDAGPEASHENWRKQKEADGWVYGEFKDPELKEHPCMVPFHELPVEQRSKDFIFRAVVHALAL